MSSLAITALRPEEAEALAELAQRIWRHNYPGIISEAQIDYMLASRYHPPLIRQTLGRGDHWDVARDGEAPVAFAHSFSVKVAQRLSTLPSPFGVKAGFREACFAPPEPVGCAKPAVGRGGGGWG